MTSSTVSLQAATPQKKRQIDVQAFAIASEITILRSRTWDRLKFEIEYGLQRGTTANTYLLQADKTALLDPPGETFTQIFLDALQKRCDLKQLDYIILGHVNPNRAETLKTLLDLNSDITIVCSNPGAIALRAACPDRDLNLKVVRGDDTLNLGKGHYLQFVPTPTPRWPDGLCTYDQGSQILFTDKFFGAHVCGDQVFDEGWTVYNEDRRYYFDCLMAPHARQVETALSKLADFSPRFYATGHGPLVQYSLPDLTQNYRQWSQQQKSQDISVALLYASAYGNTTTLANAIARGMGKAGVRVDAINCEAADPEEIKTAIEKCAGFAIGSPTLGGHAPTQIQTALGIVLSTAGKGKLAGVFGSFGWSGEAIDLLENKLRDAGFSFGFETMRVKFKPTDTTLQCCEQAGTDFAQALKKAKKSREGGGAYRRKPMETNPTDARVEHAIGRLVGSLSIVTAKQGEVSSAMLASWVSQATFNPPGLTVAVAKDRAVESLLHTDDRFVLNILAEGKHLGLMKHFLKPFKPGEDRFQGVETEISEASGCPILKDALAYLDCQVENRMECGDHWILYAQVQNGQVLQSDGITAVHHRKSGNHY